MKKIVIGTTEIEVNSLTPFAYAQGKGEKVLQIEVAPEVASFEYLRSVLEGATEPICYKEDDKLICEYVGYGVFEAQYKNGVYKVELHKSSLDEQMSMLLNANERISKEIANINDEANEIINTMLGLEG